MESREMIAHKNHPYFQHLLKLRHSKRYRQTTMRALLFGRKLIEEAAAHGVLLSMFGVGDLPPHPHSYQLEEKFFLRLTEQKNPEWIGGEVQMKMQLPTTPPKRLLVLESLSDPGNLGALLRSARAFGWNSVFLLENSVDPYNEKALRGAMGATFALDITTGSWSDLLQLLIFWRMELFAADAQGEEIERKELPDRLALLIGSEAHGISDEARALSTIVALQMKGGGESLNAAIAGSILMYLWKGS